MAALACLRADLGGHETITTKLTWSKEVSRVVYKRCASCHRPEGKAFSLLTYEEARPWAASIQEQVLRRQMPPWNAVKGFGDFAHDRGLSQEEIHLISDWVEGGAPEGDPQYLPERPRPNTEIEDGKIQGRVVRLSSQYLITKPSKLLAISPKGLAEGSSVKVIAVLPDGSRLPVIWLQNYNQRAQQTYELAEPVGLAKGTKLWLAPPLSPGQEVRIIIQ
jgi:hypothetical protein